MKLLKITLLACTLLAASNAQAWLTWPEEAFWNLPFFSTIRDKVHTSVYQSTKNMCLGDVLGRLCSSCSNPSSGVCPTAAQRINKRLENTLRAYEIMGLGFSLAAIGIAYKIYKRIQTKEAQNNENQESEQTEELA